MEPKLCTQKNYVRVAITKRNKPSSLIETTLRELQLAACKLS